jgi:NAD(P)-dependent dehydrogenase (short-subunit alcohol dehydrogenase family)
MRLKDKIAIITGAGQGIGRATALSLAREGADIVVNDIEVPLAEKVAQEIASLDRKALPFKADVSISQDVKEMVETTLERFGKIDILVNNAGIVSQPKPFWETSENDWDKEIAVNLKGVLNCSKSVIKSMMDNKYGKIVNISSASGKWGTPDVAVYSATKAAVIGFTKALARGLAPYGINVNCIAPGPIKTALLEGAPQELINMIVQTVPINRIGIPEDIAAMATFLVSDESSFITGQAFSVDGGRTMQ